MTVILAKAGCQLLHELVLVECLGFAVLVSCAW